MEVRDRDLQAPSGTTLAIPYADGSSTRCFPAPKPESDPNPPSHLAGLSLAGAALPGDHHGLVAEPRGNRRRRGGGGIDTRGGVRAPRGTLGRSGRWSLRALLELDCHLLVGLLGHPEGMGSIGVPRPPSMKETSGEGMRCHDLLEEGFPWTLRGRQGESGVGG